jgi:nucleotide-binding universal stress UspA family protein
LPAQGLCEVASEEHADLVVVGGRGRECFTGVMLGSVAERVLRDAPCPVLMVRKQ